MESALSGSGWIPDHQLDVVESIAHVNELIEDVGTMLYEYSRPGPIRLQDVVEGSTTWLEVLGVTPVPSRVNRRAADAMNAMRSLLEHAIAAEAEKSGPLTVKQMKTLELPAFETVEKFDAWLRHGTRRTIPALSAESDLVTRIRALQPFQMNATNLHPLAAIVSYTNLAKHRKALRVRTLLGEVVQESPYKRLPKLVDEVPLEPGTRIASTPAGVPRVLGVWPSVCVENERGEWRRLMAELHWLEEWVRTFAAPTLIAGAHDVGTLPPAIDISVGHDDLRGAIDAQDPSAVSGYDRSQLRLGGAMARQSIPQTLALVPGCSVPPLELHRWAASLSNDEAIEIAESFGRYRDDPYALVEYSEGLLERAVMGL